MRTNNLICIDDTHFIFRTNFSGDPARDNYGSDKRRVTIVIPDENQAMDLIEQGFNVKQTKPQPGKEDGFEPEYYVGALIDYDSKWPPRIHLVSGNAEPVLLDEDSVGELDECQVLNVNVVLNPWYNKKTGRKSLYVKTMYVEQDTETDPYAHRYARRNENYDEAPF